MGHTAVTVFSEQAVATFLEVAHVGTQVKARLKGKVPWQGGTLEYDLFLDAPRPVLRAAAPTSARLVYPFVAKLYTHKSATIEGDLVVEVFPTLVRDAKGAMRLVIPANQHVVRGIDIHELHEAAAIAVLGVDPETPAFQSVLETVLGLTGDITADLTHEFFSLLDDYGIAVTGLRWRALDQCLAIGVDTAYGVGTLEELTDVRRPGADGTPASLAGDVAAWLDPSVLPRIVADQQAAILAASGQAAGIALAAVALALDDRGLIITLDGTMIVDDGPDVVLHIVARARVSLDRDRVRIVGPFDVHVDAVNFDAIAEALTWVLPISGLILRGAIALTVSSMAERKADLASVVVRRLLAHDRSMAFVIVPGGPPCKLWTTQVGLDDRGVFVQGTLAIVPTGGIEIDGSSAVEVTGSGLRAISVSPRIAQWTSHPGDLGLRLRWELRARDSNALIAATTQKRDQYNYAHPWTPLPPHVVPGGYVVTVKLIKASARSSRVLASARRELPIFYNLQQAKYVQSSHDMVIRPVRLSVAADGSPQREVQPTRTVRRFTKLHRLDPLRCRFATRISSAAIKGGPPGHGTVTLMNSLPFPVAELVSRRGELCPYCFFGGPDKHTLLPLP